MDDIDKEIKRARLGKKRETAYEIINHQKIPATNLPPLSVKGKVPLMMSDHSFKLTRGEYTIDAHGNPMSYLSNISLGEKCQQKNDLHGKGTDCDKPTTNYCRLCGKQFCIDHYLPENHGCPMVFY